MVQPSPETRSLCNSQSGSKLYTMHKAAESTIQRDHFKRVLCSVMASVMTAAEAKRIRCSVTWALSVQPVAIGLRNFRLLR